MDKQEFRKIIEERIGDEKKVVRLLHDSINKTRNTVVRLLFYQLALDSTKHEHMLITILHLLEHPSKEQFESESEEFRKLIEKHVELEREMLENFESIVDKVEDNRIRLIIQDLIGDEKKHHALMKRIYKLVWESEKIKDEKWWDFLFRYSRLIG